MEVTNLKLYVKPFRELTAIVTGGAGFIGSTLVDAMVSVGLKKIIVVDNFFLGKEENLREARRKRKDIRVCVGDVTDYNFLRSLLKRHAPVDVVFNLAVKPLMYSFVDPVGAFQTSVLGVQNLLELQRSGQFRTLIHVSSSEAYGTARRVPMREDHVQRPTTPYGAGKAAADHLALSYDLTFGNDVSVVRPFNNYGPRQNEKSYAGIVPTTILTLLEGRRPVIFGDGEQTRDFTCVKDTAGAILQAYQATATRSQVINICSGREISMKALVKTICALMRYKGKIDYQQARAGDVRRLLGSNSLARKILSYRPSVSLVTGLSETIRWYVEGRGGSK